VNDDEAAANYPGGVPNPERVGFISLSHLGGGHVDQTEAIAAVALRLGRPARFKDAAGYEQEIVGACVGADGARLAWIEARSKWLTSVMDIEFVLHATERGRETITWTVDTYNPFFGCQVGWMGWMGDDVVAIYREKHKTLIAVVRADAAPRLFEIEDEWMVIGGAVYYASRDDEGLAEGVLLPDLTRLSPIAGGAAARMTAPLRAPCAEDPRRFQGELRDLLFGGDAPQPEADLLIGALAHRFWDRWPEATNGYASGLGLPWLTPCWLPFYWHVMTQERGGGAHSMLDVLDRLAAQPDGGPPTSAVAAAAGYVRERSGVLAAACRAGALPRGSGCLFWIDWSVEAIEEDLPTFPEGFVRAFELLRPQHARWRTLGDRFR
jgi:hypothetical protein